LLRRFPLEAGVSPQFTELDDRAAKLMREEIIEEMADSAASETLSVLATLYTGEDFSQLAAEVAREAQRLSRPLSRVELAKLFDLPPDLTPERLLAQVFLGDEPLWMPEVVSAMARGKDTDAKAAMRLGQLDWGNPQPSFLPELEGLFLYGADAKTPFGAKTDRFPTKDTRQALGELGDKLANLMRRVEDARPQRLALRAVERSAALHRFAAAFLPIYAERKTLRGALDFDDLIARAKGLLTDPAVAQWVLFRLDGGIDHILVDEAQDTSPDQWRVIELLAQEFTSGQGARDLERTIFVVGDQKQSIYSFQGADVSAFSRMRETFRDRLDNIGAPFQTLELEHSFRSSPAVLDLVDATFPEAQHAALGGPSHHIAFQQTMPGRVEIWPPIAPASNPEDEDWSDPVDLIAGEHHTAELGRRVADRIAQILAAETLIPGPKGPRRVTAGDFLILVRRRSPLFSEVIRACKAAGLPIAGADRLHLGGEMAVKDIKALLAFLTLPEDDLALAELLRSPLFGMTEAQLYAVAQPRKGYLWEALRHAPEHAEIVSVLADLRDNADFLRPFDLIERALTRHDGRRKFLARLGAEAEDGIDALLAQALAYERNEVPSLTGFLTWLQTDDVQIKRQMEGAGGKIRVMTVHGAKGLEAPIVILPDTADLTPQDRNELYAFGETAVWRMPSGESPAAIE
ncbi:MAG: UvrD-helicase domain-containing protein, partial [Gemmobacter sp.]|uniref:UvrD-helicase domain-containing protein n=1 Tax=Gemmobacter sp. TaxID=1898957 RepID=UPI001A393158